VTKRCDKAKEISIVPIKYLERRDDGRSKNYYVRMTAPKVIHHLLPKAEYRKSTGTADLKRANVIGAEMVARKLEEWRALEDQLLERQSSPVVLSQALIDQVAASRLHSWVFSDDDERWSDSGLDDEELQAIESFCKTTDAQMRSILSQGRGSKEWRAVVEMVLEWCEVQGHSVSITDPMFPQLVRAFAKVEQRAQEFIAARNRGDEVEVSLPAAQVGERLSAIVDAYIAYKTPTVKGPKPVSMAVSIWKKFVEFKGDVVFDEVTSGDIYDFFAARLNATTKPWSQDYVDGHAKRCLKEMFSFARTKSYMTAPNPVSSLEIVPKLSLEEQTRRQKPRFPFTPAQVGELFTSEWYKVDTKAIRGKCREDLAVRYFAPLIGLFHGPRVREYLQLMTSDVIVVDGIDCFKFQVEIDSSESETANTQDLPDRSLKKPTVARTIPIHPRLIELGLLDYVKARRAELGGVGPLFKSSVPKPGGKTPMWGRAFEQSFLRFVRDTLGFGSGYGSHSFRHLFEDRLRSAQAVSKSWPAGLAQFLSGRLLPRDADRDFFRSVGSEQDYGNGYGPKDALPYLAQVDFSDITLPVKFSDWRKS
jgi:integrase